MRKHCFKLVFMALAAAACASSSAEASPEPVRADPTRPTELMADRLKLRAFGADALKLRALVVGAAGDGVALVGSGADDLVGVRRGTQLSREVDGVEVSMSVRAVTSAGVEVECAAGRSLFLPGSYTPLPAPASADAELVGYLEASDVPLDALLRLVADQTGVNISASEATSPKKVTIFLRNVTAESAVEEICRTAGLWFRRETGSGVIRVTTMEEYADNLNTFREETTEMFTLLYPNVVEVAGAIYGLYPDRTLLSLGEEDVEEDPENDLSRRFERLRVIEDNGGSQFMKMEAPQTTGGSGGSSSGTGTFSFSRGGGTSRLSQWDQLRRRSRPGRGAGAARMSAAEAKFIDEARAGGDQALSDAARREASMTPANIFVTLSRRNNILMVRTSDVRVMDEIRRLVKRLDVPTPMVLLDMKVLELEIDDDYTAQFSYSFNARGSHSIGHNGNDPGSLLGEFLPQMVNPLADATMTFKVLSDNLKMQVQLLEQDKKLKTLATPTLLTANNEVSRIFSGKEYPIVKGVTAGETVVSDSGIVTQGATVNIEWEDVGTMLLVTPNINADKTVTLRVLQENSEISAEHPMIPLEGGATTQKTEVDMVESRSLTGTFIAKDGMTVMAGGLIKETVVDVYTRTPVLGSLPLVGWLFRGTEKVRRRTELIVLITPHVISTPFEGGRISRELLDAISAHPARDGRGSMMVHKAEDGNDDDPPPRGVMDDVKAIVE